jgi:phage terminase large subunit-like protein
MARAKKELTRGEQIIAFIEKYCIVPEGEHVGKPLKLAPFQKKFIREVYDNPHGTRRAYLSIARKNAKTALIACLVLAHLVGPAVKLNGRMVSGAQSREQAAQVFELASKMVRLSPKLAQEVRIVPSGKRLIGLPNNTEFQALAADGTTAHGLSPVLAILDEVGQVRGPKDDFVDAITTSQGAHEAPLLIAISTQAASDADLFSLWLDDAERSKDPHIISHVYTAPLECALDDVKAWKAANPALGVFRSRKDLEEQAKHAVRMPATENTFRWLCLNQRIQAHSPFVSKNIWNANAGAATPEAFEACPVYAGLDLSARQDLTALVVVAKDAAGLWHVRPYFWAPAVGLVERARRDRAPYDLWAQQGYLETTPGSSIDYDYVAQRLAEIAEDCDLRLVAYDRWRMDVMQKALADRGIVIPLHPHGQGYKDMSPALDGLEGELVSGRLRHGGHPILTWNAANAIVTRDPAGNRKLDKSKATGRIDGMIALAMALGAASSVAPETVPVPGIEIL